MNLLFADTSFFVAYLNPRDVNHALASESMTTSDDRIVRIQWVLAELGNFLAEGPNRRLFGPLVRALSAEDRFEIVTADGDSFARGFELFVRRPDKEWSFTDCVSFDVMKDRAITDALTADHHFEQAGFTVLLKKK